MKTKWTWLLMTLAGVLFMACGEQTATGPAPGADDEACQAGGQCDDEKTDDQADVKEICGDKVDNDADGYTDEGCGCLPGQTSSCYSGPDGTQDVGPCRAGTRSCDGEFWSACQGEVTPGMEVCDGLDNDCDGEIDEGLGLDQDQDGHFPEGACRQPADDCDDADGSIHPGAPELCDNKDNDCDGETDEDFPLGETCQDGLGECQGTGIYACAPDGDFAFCWVEGAEPTDEICDGLDNDCDGETDEGLTRECLDCEGTPLPQQSVCDDAGWTPCPTFQEVCDGEDNDCDGLTDEDLDCPIEAPLYGCNHAWTYGVTMPIYSGCDEPVAGHSDVAPPQCKGLDVCQLDDNVYSCPYYLGNRWAIDNDQGELIYQADFQATGYAFSNAASMDYCVFAWGIHPTINKPPTTSEPIRFPALNQEIDLTYQDIRIRTRAFSHMFAIDPVPEPDGKPAVIAAWQDPSVAGLKDQPIPYDYSFSSHQCDDPEMPAGSIDFGELLQHVYSQEVFRDDSLMVVVLPYFVPALNGGPDPWFAIPTRLVCRDHAGHQHELDGVVTVRGRTQL